MPTGEDQEALEVMGSPAVNHGLGWCPRPPWSDVDIGLQASPVRRKVRAFDQVGYVRLQARQVKWVLSREIGPVLLQGAEKTSEPVLAHLGPHAAHIGRAVSIEVEPREQKQERNRENW